MSAWSSGSQALAMAMLLVFTLPTVLHAAPVADQQHSELETYYPVADATGCYYNFQHYDEGDRIITNEPCLNCTCHNRMLMCYLRVCPFIKAIGEDCKVEKRSDQCCPVITCPEVPVQLLTSSTTQATTAHKGGDTAIGHLDTYGCSIDRLFYADGARVPSDPSNPCELCYCIRNRTACVMQECTLHIQGCAPIYHEGVCCPVRYDCDHPEEVSSAAPALTTTTPEPATTGLIFTTTQAPGASTDCVFEGELYADGALVKKDVACEHCYCMKGDIVCAVQECAPTPLDKVNCKAVPPSEGKCCPDTYDCENVLQEDLTTAIYELTTIQPTIAPEVENIIPEHEEHTLPPVTPTESTETVPKEGEESATDVARPHEERKPETPTTEVPEAPVKDEEEEEDHDILETPVDEGEHDVEITTEEVERPVTEEAVYPPTKEVEQPATEVESHPVTDTEEEHPVTEKEEVGPVTEGVMKEAHPVAEKQPETEEEKHFVTEIEQQSVTEEEAHPVTEEERHPVTESVQHPVPEADYTVTEEPEQPVTTSEQRPVKEEEQVGTEAQLRPVTEEEQVPVTDKDQQPIKEIGQPVTEQYPLTEKEVEQATTEEELYPVTEEEKVQPVTDKLLTEKEPRPVTEVEEHVITEEEQHLSSEDEQHPVTEPDQHPTTAEEGQVITDEGDHPVTEEEQYQVPEEEPLTTEQAVHIDKAEGPPALIPGEDITEEPKETTTEIPLPEEKLPSKGLSQDYTTAQPTEEAPTIKTIEEDTTPSQSVEESITTPKSIQEGVTTIKSIRDDAVTVKPIEEYETTAKPTEEVTTTKLAEEPATDVIKVEKIPITIDQQEGATTQEPVSVTEQEVGEVITVTPQAPKQMQPEGQITEVLQPEITTLHDQVLTEAGEPIVTEGVTGTEKTVTSEEHVTVEKQDEVTEGVQYEPEHATEDIYPTTEGVQHITEIEPVEKVTDMPTLSTDASVTEHEAPVTEGEEPQSVTEGEVVVTEKEHVPDEEHPSSEMEQTPAEITSDAPTVELDLHTQAPIEHITEIHVETTSTTAIEDHTQEVSSDESTQGPEVEPIQPHVVGEEEEEHTVGIPTPYHVKEQPTTTVSQVSTEQPIEVETSSYAEPIATTEIAEVELHVSEHTPQIPTERVVESETEPTKEDVTEEIADIVHEPISGEDEIESTTLEPTELETTKHVEPMGEETTSAPVSEESVSVTIAPEHVEHIEYVETEPPEVAEPETPVAATESGTTAAAATTTTPIVEPQKETGGEPAESATVIAGKDISSEKSTDQVYQEPEQQVTSGRPEAPQEATTLPSEEEEIEEGGFTTAFPIREHAIPGEGSCLVDGQTYSNNTSVPPINHCQLSCKCISSILQCENVVCSPAPSNLQNCMPVYQGPDSCCPTYSCTVPGSQEVESDSHKMEDETTTSVQLPVEELGEGLEGTTSPIPAPEETVETGTTEPSSETQEVTTKLAETAKVDHEPTESHPLEEGVSQAGEQPVTEEETTAAEDLATEAFSYVPTKTAEHEPTDALHVPIDSVVEEQTEGAREGTEAATSAPTESIETEPTEAEEHLPAEHDESAVSEDEVQEVTTLGGVTIEDKEKSKEGVTTTLPDHAIDAIEAVTVPITACDGGICPPSVPTCLEGADCVSPTLTCVTGDCTSNIPACSEGADCVPQEYIPVPIVPCANGQPCEPAPSEIPVVVIPSEGLPVECKEDAGCISAVTEEMPEEECKEADCAPSVTEEPIPVAHVPQCEGEVCKYPETPTVTDAETVSLPVTEEEPKLTTPQPSVKDTEGVEEESSTLKIPEEQATIKLAEEEPEHTTHLHVEPPESITEKATEPIEIHIPEEVTTAKPAVDDIIKTELPAEDVSSEPSVSEETIVTEKAIGVTLPKGVEPYAEGITPESEKPTETEATKLEIEPATTQMPEVITDGQISHETTAYTELEEETPKGTLPTAPYEGFRPEEATTEAKEIVSVDTIPEGTPTPIESDEHVLVKTTTQAPGESTSLEEGAATIKSVEEHTPIDERKPEEDYTPAEEVQTPSISEEPVEETKAPTHEITEIPGVQPTETPTHEGTETSVSQDERTTLKVDYEEPETATKVQLPVSISEEETEVVPEPVTEKEAKLTEEVKPIEEEPTAGPTTEYSAAPEGETEKRYEVTPATEDKVEIGEEPSERPLTEEPEDVQSEDVTAEDSDATPRPIPGEDTKTSPESETSSEQYITETAKPSTEEVVTKQGPVEGEVPPKEGASETERVPSKDEEEETKAVRLPPEAGVPEVETTPIPEYFTTATIHDLLTQSTPLPVITTTITPSQESPEHRPEIPDYQVPGAEDEEYDEEEQSFGPGTCRYGGKVYVSAQQIPRDDPCDFCFCFRSDIICLQQSCPPPIPRCHEEPIRGFCCPRYECPVSMATSVNITTTTTTTTTTLPPHFSAHAYKGRASRTGCLIQGHSYKVGETVRSASGPCLHCVCGGDGQMQCDPKVCSPEPMLRQMIAAAASKRRR